MNNGLQALESYYRALDNAPVPNRRTSSKLFWLAPALAAAAAYAFLLLCSHAEVQSSAVPDALYNKQRMTAGLGEPPVKKRAEVVLQWPA